MLYITFWCKCLPIECMHLIGAAQHFDNYWGPCSVHFSHSVVSDSLWPHELQDARFPCPSLIPEACTNSCPSSQWCYPTISSSVIPFSCLQPFPESGSFLRSLFFTLGGQNIGVSASASKEIKPVNPEENQSWVFIGRTDAEAEAQVAQW